MKIPYLKMLAAIGVALPAFLAVNPAAMAQADGGCLSGREAQQAYQARRIMSFDRAATAAGVSPQDIVSQTGAKLCDVDGNPYWRVNIEDEEGYKTVDLPAQGD